jgi:hypothetical protein
MATANTGTARSGTLTVGGLTYTVNQAGAPCSYTLSTQSSGSLAAAGASGSFTFTATGSSCTAASAVSYNNWITVTSTSGTTSGSVNYTVAANLNPVARSGAIQLGYQTYVVTQAAAACGYTLSPIGSTFSLSGGVGQVAATASSGCTAPPAVSVSQPVAGMVTLGTMTGPVSSVYTLPYTVAPFASAGPAMRRATVTIGGQVFSIKQMSW